MKNQEQSFQDAVAAFTHGNRYDAYRSVCRKGLNTGRSGEEVFDFIISNAPPPAPNPAKIREALRFCESHPLPNLPRGSFRRSSFAAPVMTEAEKREARRVLLPASARKFVETLRDRGHGSTTATIFGEAVRMSEDRSIALGNSPRAQAVAQLRTLGGLRWAGSIAKDSRGVVRKTPLVGNGIIDAEKLSALILAGEVRIPTHISSNPLSGKAGVTAKGAESFDCVDAIEKFDLAIVEFDELKDTAGLPSQEQIDIVAGLVNWADETDALRVVCVVWTGGKSLHIGIRVPAASREDFRRQCDSLRDLFASADDPRFRCDVSGWTTGANAATHLRLAGAIRPETGRRARLLYLREREDN